MTVLFFLADGFEETELIAPVDILRRAEADVKLVSIEDSLVVTGSHGIKIYADISAGDALGLEFDAIVFPGGLRGTERLSASIWTEKFIKTAVESGAYIAAICAAPTILSKFEPFFACKRASKGKNYLQLSRLPVFLALLSF